MIKLDSALKRRILSSKKNCSFSQLSFTQSINKAVNSGNKVWGRGDSNPHALRHMILSHARLPIPTLPLIGNRSIQ
jgi:hypothetical protein